MAPATVNIDLEIRATLQDATGLSPATATGNSNSGSFTSLSASLPDGTGDGQCKNWYLGQRTVATGAADNIDLIGTITTKLGTLNLTKVRGILIRIVSPDGTKSLKVGPNGVTNAWQGPFSAVTAGQYLNITGKIYLEATFGNGLGAVTAGTADLLGIRNDSGVSVTYDIFVVGVE